jgi:cell wall-associated NlpC family hydrolase
MVQALAFAELVLGGLFIASALTGESLGQLLTQGISAAGKEKAHGGGIGQGPSAEPSGTPIPGQPGKFFGNIPSGTAAGAITIAKKYIGTPYKWGGTNEREGFDCSGLVQSVYGQMGVKLPRTAQEQYNVTQDVSRSDPRSWQPGDLLFFSDGKEISHVGIYLQPGVMLDAPHSGARVRTEAIPAKVGEAWGSDKLVAIHRP